MEKLNLENIELLEGERLDRVNEKIELICKKDGLTFGTDAFLLASFIRPQAGARAVELGTGTGIIPLLLLARDRVAHVFAVEVQEDFAELARRNAEHNGFKDKIDIYHADIRDIRASDIGGEADVVFTNPPYMKRDSGKRNESDRKYIARHEVKGDIGDFCACAYRLLKHGGRFYCVWRPDRLSELICSMSENRLEPKSAVFVHGDAESEPSMVLVMATKGGAPSMRIMPPLFIHEAESRFLGNRKMTDRAERIYETMSFYDI